MGDRCYYKAGVRREDLPRFVEILIGETYESVEAFLKVHKYVEDGPFIEVEVEAINYGGWTETEEAAAEGLVFRGWHGAAGDYSACSFVALDKELYSTIDLDGPVASVVCMMNEEGKATVSIDEAQLVRIREYAEAWWRFRRLYPTVPVGAEEAA